MGVSGVNGSSRHPQGYGNGRRKAQRDDQAIDKIEDVGSGIIGFGFVCDLTNLEKAGEDTEADEDERRELESALLAELEEDWAEQESLG